MQYVYYEVKSSQCATEEEAWFTTNRYEVNGVFFTQRSAAQVTAFADALQAAYGGNVRGDYRVFSGFNTCSTDPAYKYRIYFFSGKDRVFANYQIVPFDPP